MENSRMSAKKPSIHLYWVTTDDHDEDWFIFARTPRIAASYHENYEGYDTGDAKADLVIARVELQRYEQGPPPCHAQIADLITLGFEVVGGDPHQRSVRFDGELYVEGHLQALLIQATHKLRKVQNIRRSKGTKDPTESN
jgi:hypothetical protein